MTEPVKRKVKVIDARYVEEADSILITGECAEGRFKQQIHSSCFTFGNKDKKTEMIATAELLCGKFIYVVFDKDLNKKIEDHYPLKYE
jgi:hypothetical protein